MASNNSETCRLVVLCSGSGTNLQAIIDAIAEKKITQCQIVKVFVNRKTAYAVKRAEQAGIPTEYFNLVTGGFTKKGEKDETKLKDGRSRYDAALAELVLKEKPDLVVLAGWMHVFTEPFLLPLDAAGVPVINLHPALPAYEDFQAGKLKNNTTGAMIHYVIAEVDRGEPIITEEIECRAGESLEDLETRFHLVEHGLIVRATQKVAQEVLARKRKQEQQQQ
ncbi:Phosphoribosylglycinamide formyltransferase [Colletotrichum chlorophyti]|uniref:phosphoribosylglycinamide formyltransferase 1 n=1 Tax=Colletotrichum chlorophyti TaxID=708187 RepID=A0A1Q8S355_9PEZI|nr:Phosphoribosylglycinamide formyltransferase [Colletotrichum chlorophyti]